ncbi:alpha/beta fold hydrolase [Streptomyces sp. G5(2025)]|uniref:alpha/beta fold hydrolase n=1 Tax=Streptomyces sp. G5(2025) TaxID=3406628 RepID=UPI003C1855C4
MRINACSRVAVAAAAMLAVGAGTLPAAASSPAEPLKRYYDQAVDWHGCTLGPDDATGRKLDAAGARCADITVPLDYSDPGGRTLTVAVSRLRATDPAHRVGAMLLNNGGPAAPGLAMPPGMAEFMGKTAGKFDLIGMDPRFVGRSTPLDCGWDVGSMIFSAGRDRSGFERSVSRGRDLAERCRRTNGDVLPYVTTRNTARDMDVVRAALGEKRISYFGYSYGSYLGEVFTELFPGRTDRMVLDGVIDPARYSQTLLADSTSANERALRAWAAWASARHGTYGLGGTPKAVLATVDRIEEAAAEQPLRVGRFRVDEHFLPIVFFGGLGSDLDAARGELATATRTLARAAEGERVQPGPWLTEMLTAMATKAGSHQGSAQAAILCGDVATRRGAESYWRAIQGDRESAPFASPLTHNITACEFWDRPVESPTVVDNDVPALLVNATGDTRTTYSGARQVREQWSRSRLITVPRANQHGVYGDYGNACVDRRVNDYLATGKLPARDLTCGAV